MGGTLSNFNNGGYYSCEKEVMNLKEKVKLLQEKIKGMAVEREKEIMVSVFKEAEWKQERKKLREEVMQLRKMVEEKESMGTKLLVEKMKEERARRDEAVDKWKQLYHAIKTELDDLIQRTCDGDGLYWKVEEKGVHMENMKKELQDKEGAIETLKAQLDSLEQEKIKKEREFDLLRQSLRIMSGNESSIQTKVKLLKTKLGR